MQMQVTMAESIILCIEAVIRVAECEQIKKLSNKALIQPQI